ncbi:NAD-dependent protein deacetylase sirtuin-1 isoform X1 [Halyomorpha halys]|uniref:NAD-dependent protein deacetylase sirtuin-1 isoform X1 n=2 Tax=Halyomorpha halys TaxID=286706 RepID=UPI0006D4EC86|nr:NAD-dependent protein deacetylase sirtuin-1 isoform X1 [Halyomorpha halys]
MANNSEEFLCNLPKRFKMSFDDSECNSNFDAVLNPTDCNSSVEEGTLIGADTELSMGSEEEKNGLLTLSDNYATDDDDDVSSTVSNVSDLSILSDSHHWKPMASSMSWLEKQMLKGVSPRLVLSQITGDNADLPDTISDLALWKLIFSYLSEPPRRNPLPKVYSLDHVVQLIKQSNKIIVLTGAGVSVSCGIPDFRSKDGVYARLAVDFPNLPDPQAMFDITFFRQDPRPFFKFAKEIYPGLFQPSPSHRFIKMIERHKKLLRNYTQNIDTLERVAGIENLIECHGSFATATCTKCGHKVSSHEIKETIFEQNIPYCTKCSTSETGDNVKGIMKPDIVFFGEGLSDTFHDTMALDKDQCDLLIVIGSSLKVRPVALIPSSLPGDVPQVLINRERLPYMNFDVELLGDSDVIIDHLCRELGGDWSQVCWRDKPVTVCTELDVQAFTSDSSDSGSSEEETEEASKESEVSKVKCQKIGKRHIVGDENTRHISLDSSRDSGIGESSNNSSDRTLSPTNTANIPFASSPDKENTYYCVHKRRYVFPGAELPEDESSESAD